MCNNVICVNMAYNKHINCKEHRKTGLPNAQIYTRPSLNLSKRLNGLNGYHTAKTSVLRPSFQTLFNIPYKYEANID